MSSFKKYYAGSRAEDIQVGTACANVAKYCKVRVFCKGVGQTLQENFIFFILENAICVTMKQ